MFEQRRAEGTTWSLAPEFPHLGIIIWGDSRTLRQAGPSLFARRPGYSRVLIRIRHHEESRVLIRLCPLFPGLMMGLTRPSGTKRGKAGPVQERSRLHRRRPRGRGLLPGSYPPIIEDAGPVQVVWRRAIMKKSRIGPACRHRLAGRPACTGPKQARAPVTPAMYVRIPVRSPVTRNRRVVGVVGNADCHQNIVTTANGRARQGPGYQILRQARRGPCTG